MATSGWFDDASGLVVVFEDLRREEVNSTASRGFSFANRITSTSQVAAGWSGEATGHAKVSADPRGEEGNSAITTSRCSPVAGVMAQTSVFAPTGVEIFLSSWLPIEGGGWRVPPGCA